MSNTARHEIEPPPAPRARKQPVRRSVFPAPQTREQAFASLAALLDQDNDDLALHERGQRALGAAKDLARASTRAEENRALSALISIAKEDLEERT